MVADSPVELNSWTRILDMISTESSPYGSYDGYTVDQKVVHLESPLFGLAVLDSMTVPIQRLLIDSIKIDETGVIHE